MFTVSHGAVGRVLLFNFIYLCSAYSGCYLKYVGDSIDLFPVYIRNLVSPTYFGLLVIWLDISLYFVMRYSVRPDMCVVACSNLVM